MFVRKKPNKSGIISVQIIDKSSRRYKMLKTIGSSSDPDTIDKLVKDGKRWIEAQNDQLDMFSEHTKITEDEVVKYLFSNVDNI
jgi:hypothetical protein